MKIDPHSAWQALASRDTRFDGVFYVGVTSTGIYCRPVCPVRPPMEANCRFYSSAEAAEKAGFRPCLRCRPELAPGNAPMDNAQRVASRVIQRLDESLTTQAQSLEALAADLGLSLRQLRRIVHQELGVTPLELRQTRRLLLAKQLLTETSLPVTEIAFASGFSSLRRFNHVFRTQYRLSPSQLRKNAATGMQKSGTDSSQLLLSWRPPFDWTALLDFLHLRSLAGVEWVDMDAQTYSRTVRIGQNRGWIRVANQAQKNALQIEFSHSLTPVLPALLRRLRHLFDLNAQPQSIAEVLERDERLHASLALNPGLRVPGAFDGFELAIRAILGQQITVKAATTLGSRFVQAFGEPLETPFNELNRLAPEPEIVVQATQDEICQLGIISTRARSIQSIASACLNGDVTFDGRHNAEETVERLQALPGIGPWTAQYIAMRALNWPDAFPREDIVIRNNLGGVTAKQAEEISRQWQPWRSYAVMHIWKNLTPVKR
ncbi:AraC family transcriptional regulator [Salmonella enterica subsp. enterica serovar Choleraesuis]|nr:AraC family transcriptional regulator [Salmonella enterica subsp. enterica serovar Choleraesuis]